jgi:hypothetical protein
VPPLRAAGVSGVTHLNSTKDWTPLIKRSLELPGFTARWG